VKNIEPFGFRLAEHGRDDRVDERFDRAISQRENQAAPVEELKSRVLVAALRYEVCADAHAGPDDVPQEGNHHRHFVANLVDEQAETDDADSEGPDTDAREFACLGRIEIEFFRPRIDEKHAGDESEGCGDQGDETPPEEPEVLISHRGGSRHG
jgi:hypothetical protein